MASLTKIGRRYEVPLTVIEGGSGIVSGILSETDQKQIPVYAFVLSRHVLRTPAVTACRIGMVLQSPAGVVYIVGDNGPSEQRQGTLWQSYRLFVATEKVEWRRRSKVIDPVAGVQRDAGGDPPLLGNIWVTIEPLDREAPDYKAHASFEQSRFITGQAVQADDTLAGRKVIRSELMLGLRIGVLN